MVRYQHRQFAGVILVSLLLSAVGAACLALIVPPRVRWILALVGFLFGVFAVLFASLALEITEDWLRWSFGIGLIHREVPLSAIARVEVTETKFIEGWGIHLTGRGWLYNVSGYGAVLVTQKDGKRFMLGSDEPEMLAEALTSALR